MSPGRRGEGIAAGPKPDPGGVGGRIVVAPCALGWSRRLVSTAAGSAFSAVVRALSMASTAWWAAWRSRCP